MDMLRAQPRACLDRTNAMRKALGAVLCFGPLFALIYFSGGWFAVFSMLAGVAFFGSIVFGIVLMVADDK